MYTPQNHYWIKSDGTIYSSAMQNCVSDADAAYKAWCAEGGIATQYPRDTAGVESDAELEAVLAVHGLRLYPPTLHEAQAAKAASIVAAHEAALAGAIALSAPTPSIVAVEACLLAASDPEGLEFVHTTLAAQRQTLLAAVDAATTVEAVQAIAVSYAV